MSDSQFEIEAAPRAARGTGAMRRMRRTGQIPGILYGAGKDPCPVTVSSRVLRKQLENEAFLSHILLVKVAGEGEDQAVVKALQRHPATSEVLHLDLLRVSATQSLTMTVPLHFENEDDAPGAKLGGVFSHHEVEAEIVCLPKDLPEYLPVDLGNLELGDSVSLSDLTLPAGVELTALAHDNDLMVASLAMPQVIEEEEDEEDLEAEAGEEGAEEASGERDESDGEEHDKPE